MKRGNQSTIEIKIKKRNFSIWQMAQTELRDMQTAVGLLDLSESESEYLRSASGAAQEVAINCVILYVGQQMWRACSGAKTSQEQARLRAEFMADLIDKVETDYLLVEEKIEREKLSDTP